MALLLLQRSNPCCMDMKHAATARGAGWLRLPHVCPLPTLHLQRRQPRQRWKRRTWMTEERGSATLAELLAGLHMCTHKLGGHLLLLHPTSCNTTRHWDWPGWNQPPWQATHPVERG